MLPSNNHTQNITMTSAVTSLLLCLLISFTIMATEALSNGGGKRKVVVSGAGGQTGQALFRKFLELDQDFEPLGLVRSEASKQALLDSGVPEANVAVCDVTDADALKKVVGDDVVAFCIATSAKPAPTEEKDPETGRPIFSFPNGQPELVDWIGQKNQIDACPKGTHIVLCSTMGGTNPDHPLNNLGRVTKEDGLTEGGNIVRWKRKAEMYLMEQSPEKLYTIVHPGGLLNESGGERELVVGVDDDMSYGNTESRTVPREDVAQVMLEAVLHPEVYAGRSFDLRAKPVGEGDVTKDFVALMEMLEGKNCDYSLGAIM
jgi:nucleoside-diphosphate-sugar epimerase